MPGSREIRAGKAAIEVTAEDKFTKALAKMQNQFEAFGARIRAIGLGFGAAGSAIAAPLLAATRQFESVGSSLNDLAGRSGLSVKNLSELAFAAGQTGASIEDVETASKRLSKTLIEASRGNAEAAATLRGLGIASGEIQKLAAAHPDEAFEAVASAIASIENPTAKTAAALEVFGKSGTKILPMLAELGALRARAGELGGVWGERSVGLADALGDAVSEIKTAVQGVSRAIGTALAPVLTDVAKRTADAVAGFGRWLSTNASLVQSTAAFAAGLVAVGAGLVAAGGGLTAIGMAAGAVVKIYLGFKSAILGVGAALATLATPAGIAAATFAGAGLAILRYSDAGQRALDFLSKKFSDLATTAKEAWGAIGQAMAAGDIVAAANIAWSGLKIGFLSMVRELREAWYGFVHSFNVAITESVAFASSAFVRLAAQIQSIWTKATSFLDGHFDELAAELAITFSAQTLPPGPQQDAALQSIGEQLAERKGKRAADTSRDLTTIEQQRRSHLADLEKSRAADLASIDAGTAGKMRQADEQLARAKREYAEALERARAIEVPANSLDGRLGAGRAPADFDVEGVRRAIKAADDTNGAGGPRATFAMARSAFSRGDDVGQQQHRETMRVLQRIERNTAEGGVVFT